MASHISPESPEGPADSLSLRLLGQFVLLRGDLPVQHSLPDKSRQILAFLALHPHQDHSRAFLAGAFWPEVSEENAGDSLRQAIAAIRKVLKPLVADVDAVIVTTRLTRRFVPPPGFQVDALKFKQLASTGLNPAVDLEERIASLEAAASLYRGMLLPGFFEDWCDSLRVHLQMLYDECLSTLVDAHMEQKRYLQAVRWARTALANDPSEERFLLKAMRALHLHSDTAGALQLFEEIRHRLSERDLEPSPEAEEFYHRLRIAPPIPAPTPVPVRWDRELVPLIGRIGEIDRLWMAWLAACRGVGQLVFLSGESGIGKSRLSRELMLRVEATGGLPVYGQGYHLQKNLLYQPLIDAVQSVLSLTERASLDLGAPVTLAPVARLVSELQDRFPDLRALPVPDEESQLFDGLGRFFLNLARQRPLCLVMDDLQWADDSTLRFLHYLWRHAAEAPLLLVIAFRQEEARENAILVDWLREVDGRRPETRIVLPRLTQAAVTELLDHLSSGSASSLLPTLARQLHQETEGNPLFLLMTLHALVEEEYLSADKEGILRPGRERVLPERLPVPSTVRQVIRERLARLGEAERSLLNAAAVLGQHFEFLTVCRMVGQESAEEHPSLERLLAGELLRCQRDGDLAFTHDRIREILYEDLPPPRRQMLHLKAGEALEAQLGAKAAARAAELTHHFLESRDPRATEPAIRYSLAAGKNARSLSAHGEAVRHLETALDLLDSLPEDEPCLELRGQVIYELFRAYLSMGQSKRSTGLLEGYIDRCHQAQFPAGEARARFWLAELLLWEHVEPGSATSTRVEILLQRAINLCVRHDLKELEVKPLLELAFNYWSTRRNLPAQEQLLVAVTGDLDRLSRDEAREALALLIGVHSAQGRWQEAHDTFRLALAYGGPQPFYLYLLLARLEEQLEQEGRQQRFVELCREWQAQVRDAGIEDLPLQWFLEATHAVPVHEQPLLKVRFAEAGGNEAWALPPGLTWVDPLGVGMPDLKPGRPLILAPPRGLDLWPPLNLNAPRLMYSVLGDFIAETQVEIQSDEKLLTGLLLWHSERNFIRLDRVRSEGHGDRVQVEAVVNGRYVPRGQGRYTAPAVWLRLERVGEHVRGLCSEDRERWWRCGEATFPADGPVQVGLACVALTAATAAFHQFTVWRPSTRDDPLEEGSLDA